MIHAFSLSTIATNSQVASRVCLRYAVSHDRIQLNRVLTLTKDLKDRYYSVSRKLVRNRPWNGDESSKSKVLGLLSFEKGTGATAPIIIMFPVNLRCLQRGNSLESSISAASKAVRQSRSQRRKRFISSSSAWNKPSGSSRRTERIFSGRCLVSSPGCLTFNWATTRVCTVSVRCQKSRRVGGGPGAG